MPVRNLYAYVETGKSGQLSESICVAPNQVIGGFSFLFVFSPSLRLGVLNTQPQYFQDLKREGQGCSDCVQIHSLRSLLLLSGLFSKQGENPSSHWVLKTALRI